MTHSLDTLDHDAPQVTLAPFLQVARHANCGIWVLDSSGYTIYANDACAEMLRTTSDAMIGTSFLTHVADADRDCASALFARHSRGIAVPHEFCFTRSDGTRLSTLISGFPVIEGDRLLFHVGMLVDLAHTYQTGHDRQLVTDALENMVRLFPLPVSVIDTAGRVVFANTALATLVGLPLDAIKQQQICLFARPWTPGEPARLDLPLPGDLAELMADVAPLDEWAVLTRPDDPRVLCVMRTPLTGAAGIHGDCVVYHDVTETMRSRLSWLNERSRLGAELKTHESIVRLQASAMDATMEGMAILHEGRFVYMNPAHAEMYGWAVSDLIGESWTKLYGEEGRAHVEVTVSPALERDGRWRGDLVGRMRNGAPCDIEVSLSKAPDGYLVCACRDIAERKQRERGLRESVTELDRRNVELQDVNRLKDMFLACMSHELRTPLHSILGSAEILSEGLAEGISERQARFVGHITESGRHLLGLINDVLDVAKIGAGEISLERELVSLDYLLSQAIEMVSGSAKTKQVVFQREPCPDDGPHVHGDERRIVQILVNLLSNAAKFSPPDGVVAVRLRLLGLTVEIDVEDSGPGILAADMARLFQPFQQLDGALTRRHDGSGLGLYLARQLARLHGGDVTAQSTPGVGSRFTLILPLGDHRPGATYVKH